MKPIHHPRPQLRRDNWKSLDGEWKFLFDDNDLGRKEAWEQEAPWDRTINVPFSYETKKSGIDDQSEHRVVWYEREIDPGPLERGERKILHFEGVDYLAEVWVNGRYAGSHTGPYSRFSLDITALFE